MTTSTVPDNPLICITYHEPLDSSVEFVDRIECLSPLKVSNAKVKKHKSNEVEYHKANIIIPETINKRTRYRFRWKMPISFSPRSKSVGRNEKALSDPIEGKSDDQLENNYVTISSIDSTKLGNELMAQKDIILKSIKVDDSNSKNNFVFKGSEKKSHLTGENHQKSKGGLFKNFGKSKQKSEIVNSSNITSSKVQQKTVSTTAQNNLCSECPPPKSSKFTVETSNPQLFPIYQRQEISSNQCNHIDTFNTTLDSTKSKKVSKGFTMISDKTMKLMNLDSFRFRSNSGTYHGGTFKLPDPTKLPEYEPFSSLTFCKTPLKSADDDRYWVTDSSTEKGHFKRLSKTSFSKSEQNLVYNEPSKRIEEALSQSMLQTDSPNATIQVAYRHGVNRVTENDHIVMLSKTSTRDRSTYLSEGVHRLDESETFYAFFQHSTCYDLMPHNSKLVVLDSRLQVGKAFRALIFNGVRAAIIWKVELQQYVGILTITDFINILNLYVQESPNLVVDIESETIDKWREITGTEKKPLLYVRPESSLFIALKELRNHRVHRLPVIDLRSGNVLHIITHKRLLKYLYIKKSKIPQEDFLKQTVKDVGVGTFDPVYTATLDSSVKEVLEIFETRHISAVPVIDPETKKLVDLYAKFDCIHLASTGNYKDLNLTIAQALKCRSQTSFCVQTCKKTDTLAFVMEKIVLKEVHRLVVINNESERLVEGIVSLADLLHFFVLRMSGRHSSGNILNGVTCCGNLNTNSTGDGSIDGEIRRSSSHSTVE